MKFVLELPEEVAEELLAEPDFVKPLKLRGPAAELADYTMTAMNVGATAVTLSQGPDALRKVIRAMNRWRTKASGDCTLSLTGPSGTTSIRIDGSDDVDLDALLAVVGARSPEDDLASSDDS